MDLKSLYLAGNLIKEIRFELSENGFIDESNRVQRYSMVLAGNTLDIIYSNLDEVKKEYDNVEEFKQDFEDELIEIIEVILSENFESVMTVDSNSDMKKYYFDEDIYNFETIEDLEDRFGITDNSISFDRLKELFENKKVSEEDFEYIELHQTVCSTENCGKGNGLYPELTTYTIHSVEGENFDIYLDL